MTTTVDPSCTTLPLELYPSMNPLALDLVRGRGNACRFFVSDDSPPAPNRPDGSLAAALAEQNLSWGNDVRAELESWSRGESGVVVAGQQVGFGGGPLYTLVKLASLVNLKRRMAKEGRNVVALFWLATEDHDFDEAARLSLFVDGKLKEFRAHADPALRVPVGPLPVPEDLRRAVAGATDLPAEGWLEPEISFRDSFARLIVSVLGSEVVLVDSLLPELREAGAETFSKMAENLDAIQGSIAGRSERIESVGYRPQIQPSNGDRYTLFYEIDESGSRRQIEDGDRLRDLSGRKPRAISTAALMRPLLQDAVFAPEVFVGGPAEVAYYAQLGGVYEMLGVRQPRVALRSHCLVVPEKMIRGVERHGIEPHEWLDAPEEILSRRERDREQRLTKRIDALKEHFSDELEEVRRSILHVDPSLTRSLNRTSRRIDYHLGVLDRRGKRVIARSDQERFAAVERFSDAVRPDGVVQDRVVGWLSYWLMWGERLPDALVPQAEPGKNQLKIIGIS